MKLKTYPFSTIFILIILILFQLASPPQALYAQSLPPNFQDQLSSSGWNEVEGFTYDGHGRPYVWEKAGRVWIVDTNGVKLINPLIDINEEVGGWRDHGLNGFALDPNFLTNGYIYLFYTVDRHYLLYYGTGSYNSATNEYYNATIVRVTRFTADASNNFNSIVAGSRLVLIGENKKTGIPLLHESHSGGSLVFGTDGSLLISTGDGASYNFADGGGGGTYWSQGLADSIIRPKENVGAFRSQMVDCLNGKILRIDPATGDGLPTNPFYDPANPRAPKSRVWCTGLRNPFRMTLKPGSGSTDITAGDPGVLYIGDVGWGTWEDLNVAKGPGKDFGWPIYEGLTLQTGYSTQNIPNQDAPNPLYGVGGCTQQYFYFTQLLQQVTLSSTHIFPNPCNSSVQIPPGIPVFVHERPAIDWQHGNESRTGIFNGNNAAEIDLNNVASPVPGPQFGGNASVGGVWYTGTAYPVLYQNTYFHGDYGAQWIRNFSFNSVNNPTSARDFQTGSGACVFVGMNPKDQQIYYVRYPDQIRRIQYLGITNNPPTAVAHQDTSYGASPLTVHFDGSQSTDPENLPMTYLWTFGDGVTSTQASPQHTYTVASGVPTSYYAKLKVTDNVLQVSFDSVLISINNTPPVVQITSFNDGDLFTTAGYTTLPLQALVTDAEQGPGQLFYKWQTFLHHNNHEHPESPDTNKITSTQLSPVACNEVFYFRISLTVTDAAGLSTQVVSSVYPACSPPVAQFQSDKTSVCRNESIQFSDLSTNLPTNWNWSFPGGNPATSTLKNPVVKYASAGLKSVTLIVINPIGTDTLTFINYINVHQLPSANITPLGPTTFCNGTNLLLQANTGNNFTYTWKKNGNLISGAVSPSYSATKTGSYKVIVTNQYGCSTASTPLNIIADPEANISVTGPVVFCLGDSVLLTANSGAGYLYKWKLNGVAIPNQVNQNYYAKNTGAYSVKVTTPAGCSRISGNVQVTVNCKLDGFVTDNGLNASILPNPVTDQAVLNVSTSEPGNIAIRIYDAIGRTVKQLPGRYFDQGNFEISLPVEDLNSGIYFCNVKSNNGSRTIKLIVNR